MTTEVSNKTLYVLAGLLVIFFSITSILVWSSFEQNTITGVATNEVFSTSNVQSAVVKVAVNPTSANEPEEKEVRNG